MIPLYDNNPTRRAPVVTRWLMYLNVAVFLLQWWLESRGVTWMSAGYGLVPSRVSADPTGEVIKVFTSMFLHANLAHLGWNMLFLHIFGDNVEDAMGRTRYVAFYLISGLGAAIGQYWIDPTSQIPMVGASGAIAGVLGGYMVLYPRAPVVLVNPILPLWLLMGPLLALPAWIVVGYWFLGNVMGGIASSLGAQSGVAFFAHLGGFIAGLVAIKPMVHGRTLQGTSRWSGYKPPPKPPQRKIFWKEDKKHPFWQGD